MANSDEVLSLLMFIIKKRDYFNLFESYKIKKTLRFTTH